MIDEGYIKFNIHWELQHLKADQVPSNELMAAREWLYEKQWIGFDPVHQVGFGNISERKGSHFVISGTQTGHIAPLTVGHYSFVNDYHLDTNELSCQGEVKASSESLTHAAVYECDEDILYVIHIHHDGMWNMGLKQLAKTPDNIAYGTPEMALAMQDMYRSGQFSKNTPLFMAGHQGGIILHGNDLEEMKESLLSLEATFDSFTKRNQ